MYFMASMLSLNQYKKAKIKPNITHRTFNLLRLWFYMCLRHIFCSLQSTRAWCPIPKNIKLLT